VLSPLTKQTTEGLLGGETKVQVKGYKSQVTGNRSQVTGHRSQVTMKDTCEFAVSSYLVRIFLFFGLYSLFIPTNPKRSPYFSKIPCSSNSTLLTGY